MNTHQNRNSTSLVATKPILWEESTNSFLDTLHNPLSKIFTCFEQSNLEIDSYQSSDAPEHIILIDNNTKNAELLVKAIAWKVRSVSSVSPQISIVNLRYPSHTYDDKQLMMAIEGDESKLLPSGKISFKEYCQQCNQSDIDPEEIRNYLIRNISIASIKEIIKIKRRKSSVYLHFTKLTQFGMGVYI